MYISRFTTGRAGIGAEAQGSQSDEHSLSFMAWKHVVGLIRGLGARAVSVRAYCSRGGDAGDDSELCRTCSASAVLCDL
jgi:hypothetical protein